MYCRSSVSMSKKTKKKIKPAKTGTRPTSTKPLSAYLTPLEVSKILRVDRRTVYNLLRSGKLEGVKFGDSWRVQRAVVL